MNATQLLEHFDRLAEAPDAVPRLRRFILDLAVRGKLVEQDAGDEPAAELLKRIHVEKRTGNKRQCAEAMFAAADAVSIVPLNWIHVPLIALGSWAIGAGFPKNEQGLNEGEYFFLKVSDMNLPGNEKYITISQNSIDLDAAKRMRANLHQAGTIIFPKIGGAIATNKRRILTKGSAIDNNCLGITFSQELDSDWAYLIMTALDFTQYQVGTAVPALQQATLEQIAVGLPPSAEQHRIVAKVDELMAFCDQLEAAQQERELRRDRLAAASLQRLNRPAADTTPEAQREHARFHLQHLPSLTTRTEHINAMRQTILNIALRGKLSRQDKDDEPASLLFERLQLDIKSFGIQNRVQPAAISAITADAEPYPIPSGWRWTRLASLCRVVTDGDHLPPPKSEVGVAFLTIGNVSSGALNFANSRYVSQEYFDKITPYRRPEAGDLLYTVVGASYGRPVLVESNRPFCVQRHIAILKPAVELQVKYLHLLLSSPFAYDQATACLTGTAQPTIPLRPLRNFLVPLPPLAEQHRIVAKVEELMALCDQLEAQLSTTRTDSRRLLESVLDAALVSV